jgi:hypothetical protein
MLNQKYLLSFLPLLLCLSILSACGISVVGTIPRGTPDTGNGTPAVLLTPSVATQPVQTAPSSTTGAVYAFVRNNQLWMARNAALPVQVTNFTYGSAPEVFWHQPLWSAGDHFIAFIVNAVPMGLGGGGCPGPDYGANGVLYVMNTVTGQFTQVMLPTVKNNASVRGNPGSDTWQYIAWEDATHLVAWYNGTLEKVSNKAGLYRYDVNTQALTQVIPLSALGVATLFAPQPDMPLLLSLRYSSEQLFYQVVVHPFEQQSQLVIYRRPLLQRTTPDSEVVQQGSEAWCAGAQGNAFVKPGWDVSPDGEQVVFQSIIAGGTGQGVGTVQAMGMTESATTPLFTQAPADFLGRDEILTWGPDSQTIVATAYHVTSQEGPYSASLANPSAMRQYVPNAPGQVVWRANSTAFAIQNTDALDDTTPSTVYVFVPGDADGRILLADAYNFSWG